jgi:hypothetical protein
MKRSPWLLVTLFCSAIFLFAGDKNTPTEMIGWVCNAKCVDQSSGTATCNKGCSEASGDVVFINSNGQVLQISNQDMAQPMAGKKCKVMANKDPDTGAIAVQNIVEYRGP